MKNEKAPPNSEHVSAVIHSSGHWKMGPWPQPLELGDYHAEPTGYPVYKHDVFGRGLCRSEYRSLFEQLISEMVLEEVSEDQAKWVKRLDTIIREKCVWVEEK